MLNIAANVVRIQVEIGSVLVVVSNYNEYYRGLLSHVVARLFDVCSVVILCASEIVRSRYTIHREYTPIWAVWFGCIKKIARFDATQ